MEKKIVLEGELVEYLAEADYGLKLDGEWLELKIAATMVDDQIVEGDTSLGRVRITVEVL